MPRLKTSAVAPSGLDGRQIARVAGIPISLHGSWIVLVLLMTIVGREDIAPEISARPGAAAWVVGAGFALIVSACIVAHELAHSLIAKAYGMRVRGITLFALGGVSQIEHEARSPAAEFYVALAGPLSSVVIAACTATVSRALNPDIAGLPGVWGAIAIVNGYLAVFNLLPAFPMDGGRILRSAIWAGTGARARATRLAAAAGRGFATLMIGGGAVGMVTSWVTDHDFNGVLVILVGLFLFNAAGNASRVEGADEPRRPPEEPPA